MTTHFAALRNQCNLQEKPAVFDLVASNGVDGSRTRVQRQIPSPSTIVVVRLGFPKSKRGTTPFPLR